MEGSDESTLLVSQMLEKLCLATDEERKSLLTEARPHLLAPDASARFKEHLENRDFAIIFDCLNTADESMIKTTCEILSRVFDFVDSKVVIGKYDENLLRALKHPMSEVKEVVLKLLIKGLPFFKQALAVQAGKCLVDKDLSVSKQSHKFIKSLAKFRTYQNHIQIFAEPYLSTIKEMLQNPDDALKLRVLELLVEICSISQEHLEMVDKEGLLNDLFIDLKKDEDVLVQLNAIEIISNLAESKQGFEYLKSLNILSNMDVRLNEVSSGPLGHFLMPGYIKFFGRLAHHDPLSYPDLYPNFTSILKTMLETNDQVVLALEVFGHIGLTNEGKKVLLNQNWHVLEILAKTIKFGTSEMKSRSMSVFADILRSTEENLDFETTKQLFTCLSGPHSMDYVTDLTKKPFGDLSSAAFDVLMAVSVYPWSTELILNVPGYLEFLLDRSTAKDKESKDAKYALICAICGQKEVQNIIPPEILKQLRSYVKQGAFYVEATVEVAIEEQ